MEPFATIDDLNARRASDLTGRAVSVATAKLADATAKLADATAKLAAEMDASGIPWRARVAKGADTVINYIESTETSAS